MISSVDGHLTAGSFAFRVRDASKPGTPEPEEPVVPAGTEAPPPVEGNAEATDPLRWVIRAIMLAAAALLTGGSLFTVLVIEPTLAERGEAGAALWRVLGTRFARQGWLAACALLVALLLDFIAEIAVVGQTSFWAALGRSDLALGLIRSTR